MNISDDDYRQLVAMTEDQLEDLQARERVALEQDYRRLVDINREMLEALEKWMCPACGGTRIYSGYSADAPDGGPCRKCAQTDGLHPIAWAAIQKAKGKP